MTMGLAIVAFAIAAAAVTCILLIREMHLRTLDARVTKAVLGLPDRSAPIKDCLLYTSDAADE